MTMQTVGKVFLCAAAGAIIAAVLGFFWFLGSGFSVNNRGFFDTETIGFGIVIAAPIAGFIGLIIGIIIGAGDLRVRGGTITGTIAAAILAIIAFLLVLVNLPQDFARDGVPFLFGMSMLIFTAALVFAATGFLTGLLNRLFSKS